MAPSHKEWEEKKATIREYYFASTRPEMMSLMETQHNFVASKAQYEKKFKEWKFPKNLSKEERKYILHKKHQRDEAGKESAITWHSSVVPPQKLRRLEYEFSISELHQIRFGPSPASPEAVSVRTPPSQEFGVEVLDRAATPGPVVYTPPRFQKAVARNIRTDNLPYWEALSHWESENGLSLASLLLEHSSQSQGSIPRSPVFGIADSESDPFDLYPSAIDLKISSGPIHRVDVLGDRFVFEFFGFGSRLASIPPELTYKFDLPQLFLKEIQGTMLERFPGDLQNRVQTLFGLNEIEAFLEFLKFFVYFSSNYLEQIELRHSQRILHLFINLGPKLMRKIFGLNVLSVKAFLHSLILTAESVGDWGGRALLDADVDRNLYRNHLERLLLAAVKFNHISLVQALVDGGCDVNSTFGRDDEPETFLIYAHSIEVVRILLKAGAHVNNKNYHSRYGIKKLSIYFAIQQQRIDLAKELLDHGATVSGLDRQCLSNAIQYDNDELISFLFDRGATFEGKIDTERSFKTELQCAAFHGATDILGVLLDRQPYIEELYTGQSQWIVLRDAVEEGHLAAAKQLLKAGADVNASSDGCDAQEDDSDFSKIPSTPLLAAVASKDVEMVKLLASYGVNINQVGIGIPGRHRSTALEFAQYMEQYDICHVLVQNGTGVTEMVAAVQQHDKEEIRRLIELGVDSTCILDGDDTGHVDESMLSIFLSVCCGQVNVTSPKLGRSPLAIALKLKNIDLARRIIFSGADLNLPGNGFDSYLGSAVRIIPSFGSREAIHAKINLVNLMIQKGALVNERGKDRTTALGIAIKVGGLDIIKILAEAGADIHLPANRRDFSPLQIALKRLLEEDDHVQERFEIVEYLISVGCDVNSLLIPSKYRLKHGVYLSPLQCAVRSRNLCKPLRFRLLQLLMENGADVNAPAIHDGEYSTPLQVAAEVGDTKTVEMLLKHGADVNAPYNEHTSTENLEYFTALQNAARHGDMEITLILLKHGADVNAPAADRYGATALQTAAWFGDMETVLMLLDHGADIEASPAFCHGCTALQGAASSGNIKLVCMLLERGADVNAPGSMKEGRTALEFATLFGRLDIVQLLLNAEAESLETARHIAVKQDHFIIADILQDHIRTRDMGNFTELE